jgi:hypothetical protein
VADNELARLERRYRELKKRLQGLGFAVAGTITERYTTCGKANCRCHGDPPQRHGPYYQYSRKAAGKTISRLVTAEQADQYRQWIANRHALDQLTAEMDNVSHQAAQLLHAAAPAPRRRPVPESVVTETGHARNTDSGTDTVTDQPAAGSCPDHHGCVIHKCEHWHCRNMIHMNLNSRGQRRKFCGTRCRVAEHRRLN